MSDIQELINQALPLMVSDKVKSITICYQSFLVGEAGFGTSVVRPKLIVEFKENAS